MPAITWSNGSTDKADTWDALLERVRVAQWGEYTTDELRDALAKRAWRWSRTAVDPDAPAVELFAQLEIARLIEIVDREEEPS